MTELSEIAVLHRDIERYEALRRACLNPWMRKVLADAIDEARDWLRALEKDVEGAA